MLFLYAAGNMPYDLCDDEETLDNIEAEMSKRGITQDLIDETRAATETRMLNDLNMVSCVDGDLEVADSQGATPVDFYIFLSPFSVSRNSILASHCCR